MLGSMNFRQGGPGQSDKKSPNNVFFSPQLILQKSNGQFIIFQGSRGGPTFSRGWGVQHFFQEGSNYLFPIEIHITCDFPGGGGGPDPLSPLWIRTWSGILNISSSVPKSIVEVK